MVAQLSPVTQLCPSLCDPVDCSTPGLPVHHQLPEVTQTMSIESVMPSNQLILCRPLLLPPSGSFPMSQLFTSDGQSTGVPGGTSGKELTCQCRRHKRHRFNPWVGKIPWRRAGQPTPEFLPGKSHGQRSLAGYGPWGHKESDTTERLTRSLFSASAPGTAVVFLQ